MPGQAEMSHSHHHFLWPVTCLQALGYLGQALSLVETLPPAMPQGRWTSGLLCPELCPALPSLATELLQVPTWSSPSFLFTAVHILASLQGQGNSPLLHEVFLDSTLSLE